MARESVLSSPRRTALLKATLASFAIYLMPIVGPHAFWLLGQHLYSRSTRGGPEHVIEWIAMEWGLALGLQAIGGVLGYFFFVRPRWRRLVPIAIFFPVAFVVAEWGYLVALPSRFLIEPDTAAESGEWKSACVIADKSLVQARSTPDQRLAHAGEAWLVGAAGSDYDVVSMPGCHLHPMRLAQSGGPATLQFVLPGQRCLAGIWNKSAAHNEWWTCGNPPRAIARPPEDPNRAAPILSTDGRWVAWVEYIPGATVTPLPQRVVIRSLGDARERFVNLPQPGNAELILLGLDLEAEELTFYEHQYVNRTSSLIVIGLDGARRGQPLIAEGVDPQATTFLRVGDGWVAWDAYRENDPYRVAWRLANAHGIHQVPKGRGVTAVAVDPSGTYIGISTTSLLNIGDTKDAVYVLRASDGKEVWRRYLPKYARSSVAFFHETLFAYTDWDGAHANVRVLEISK